MPVAPNNVDALVADAVGRYDKKPLGVVLRLGPLSRRYAATVRFHLKELLLLWQKNLKEGDRAGEALK